MSKKEKQRGGVTGKGFDVNPQNINRKGRPPSIKNRIKKILEKEGEMPIPKKYFIKEDEDNFFFRVPSEDMIAMRLLSMALSGNRNISLKAIKIIMEHIDGKPTQRIDFGNDEPLTSVKIEVVEKEKDESGEK